jgi:hypothetical protein
MHFLNNKLRPSLTLRLKSTYNIISGYQQTPKTKHPLTQERQRHHPSHSIHLNSTYLFPLTTPQRPKHTQHTPPERRPLLQLPILCIPLLIRPQCLLVQRHRSVLPIAVRVVVVDVVVVIVVGSGAARVDGGTGLGVVGLGDGDGCGLREGLLLEVVGAAGLGDAGGAAAVGKGHGGLRRVAALWLVGVWLLEPG